MLSEKDKEDRRSGLGGTDVADLAEGKAFKVYRSKVEGVDDEIDPDLAARGRILEPAILELYRHHTGAEMLPGGLHRHPQRSYFLGNLDARAIREGSTRPVEAKTAGMFALSEWGDGEDEIPQRYLCQSVWYGGITGATHVDVAALLGGDLRVYTIEVNPALFGLLADTAERFWKEHVEPKRPPAPDSSEECAAWIAEKFRDVRGELKAATPEAEQWVREYREAQAALEAAQDRRDKAKAWLKTIIGEAPGMFGSGWRVSWSKTKGRKRIDWDGVCAEAKISEALVKKHTSAGADYRTFRFNGGSDE